MFDRTVVIAPRARPATTHTTITEKRAPTDESVRLLKELEEAVQRRILETVKVGDTNFECVVRCLRDGPSQDTIFAAVFSLNGKKIEVQSRTSDYNTRPDERIAKLIAAVAERIAAEIVQPALSRPALLTAGWAA